MRGTIESLHEEVHEAIHHPHRDVPAIEDTSDSISLQLENLNFEKGVWNLWIVDLNAPPRLEIGVRKNLGMEGGGEVRECLCKGSLEGPHSDAVLFLARAQSVFMNVLLEAILVGLVLLPIYWVAETVLGSYGKWVTLFVAGAAFHLLFEVTGLNAYYAKTKRT
jgi:hypothetical protein